jgi:hypothetical protein
MGAQRKFLQLAVRSLPTLSVDSPIETSIDLQSGGCSRASDESEHRIEATQGLASPGQTRDFKPDRLSIQQRIWLALDAHLLSNRVPAA